MYCKLIISSLKTIIYRVIVFTKHMFSLLKTTYIVYLEGTTIKFIVRKIY